MSTIFVPTNSPLTIPVHARQRVTLLSVEQRGGVSSTTDTTHLRYTFDHDISSAGLQAIWEAITLSDGTGSASKGSPLEQVSGMVYDLPITVNAQGTVIADIVDFGKYAVIDGGKAANVFFGGVLLYNEGWVNTALTGGWETILSGSRAGAAINPADMNMWIASGSGGSHTASVFTVSQVTLAGYSTLRVYIRTAGLDGSGNLNNAFFNIRSVKTQDANTGLIASSGAINTNYSNRNMLSLNTSAISSGFIEAGIHNRNNSFPRMDMFVERVDLI